LGTGRWRWGFLALGTTVVVGLGGTFASLADRELRVTESAALRDAAAADHQVEAQASTTTTTKPPPPSTTTTTTTRPKPTTTTRPTPPPTSAGQGFAARSLEFVNQKRAANGRGPLRVDPELTRIAEAWAHEMIDRQDLFHNPNLSDQVPDRFHTWGENIAYSSSSDNIDQMWWESDGHRANILNPDYTSVGIAFVQDDRGIWWAVQDFGG
jgi:uncharacterized protein YkwD